MTLIELEDEELQEMPSLEHGAIGIRLGRYLDAYVEQKGLGLVCNSSHTGCGKNLSQGQKPGC